MTPMSPETGELLAKLIAKAIDGPAALVRAGSVAILRVAECLVSCIDSEMASDIHCIKKSLLRKIRAEVAGAAGDAKKKLADAAKAANQATLHKRNGRIARAERALLEARAAKTHAEAEAIHGDAETRRLQAESEKLTRIMEAQARLIEAIAKLRQEGGDIFFDRKSLQRMLNAGVPPEPESDSQEAFSGDCEQTRVPVPSLSDEPANVSDAPNVTAAEERDNFVWPGPGTCEVCGEELMYDGKWLYNSHYCSSECAQKDNIAM